MDFTQLIKAIKVRSNYGPDIDINDPFAPAPPNPVLQRLQPQIIIDTVGGPVDISPYGQPGPTQWSNVLAGLGGLGIVVVGFALYGVYRLASK